MVKIRFNFIFPEKNHDLPLIFLGNGHCFTIENGCFGGDSIVFMNIHGLEEAFREGERTGDGRGQ